MTKAKTKPNKNSPVGKRIIKILKKAMSCKDKCYDNFKIIHCNGKKDTIFCKTCGDTWEETCCFNSE